MSKRGLTKASKNQKIKIESFFVIIKISINIRNQREKWYKIDKIMYIYTDIFLTSYTMYFTKFHQKRYYFFNLKILIFLITFLDSLVNFLQNLLLNLLILSYISYKSPNPVDSTSKIINLFSIFIITFIITFFYA